MAASVGKDSFPEMMSSNDYSEEWNQAVGRELKKISKIADWIGGKRDADGIISPIPVQT